MISAARANEMNGGGPRRLWWGLGLSLALHLGLLALWEPEPPVLAFAERPPSLSVALDAIEVAAVRPTAGESRPAPARPAPPEPPRPRPKPLPLAKPEPVPVKAMSERATETSPPPPDPPAVRQMTEAAPPALNRARIVQRLRRDLRAHFTYPPLARRRNIEGRVTVGFRLDGDGTIRNLRVVESSGHAILDLAAERTLRRLHRVEWYPAMTGGRPTDIELPVVYRLTNRGT